MYTTFYKYILKGVYTGMVLMLNTKRNTRKATRTKTGTMTTQRAAQELSGWSMTSLKPTRSLSRAMNTRRKRKTRRRKTSIQICATILGYICICTSIYCTYIHTTYACKCILT